VLSPLSSSVDLFKVLSIREREIYIYIYIYMLLSPCKMPKGAGEMHAIHYYFFIFLFVIVFSSSNGMSNALDDAVEKRQPDCELSLGAVVDYTSLAGKKEKVAMKMALKDFNTRTGRLRHNATLHVINSRGDPIRAASSGQNSTIPCLASKFMSTSIFLHKYEFSGVN
jgi:hypothetical protein